MRVQYLAGGDEAVVAAAAAATAAAAGAGAGTGAGAGAGPAVPDRNDEAAAAQLGEWDPAVEAGRRTGGSGRSVSTSDRGFAGVRSAMDYAMKAGGGAAMDGGGSGQRERSRRAEGRGRVTRG